MSEENGKVCCTCRHCIRMRDDKGEFTHCECELNHGFLHYWTVMSYWCRHWSKEQERDRRHEGGVN